MLKLIKDGFPLSRNFYVRTCVKFTFANEIEAMFERSHVNVKFEPRSTFFLNKKAQHSIACVYFIYEIKIYVTVKIYPK